MTMADAIDAIEIPKWGLTMRTGTVVSWHANEGDRFAAGDHLATIESTKVTGELEAPFSGTLRRIVAAPGTTLPVGSLIAVSAPASVPDPEIDAFVTAHATAPVTAPGGTRPAAPASAAAPTRAAQAGVVAEQAAATVVPDSLRGQFDASAVNATPATIRYATRLGVDLPKVTGTGRLGRITSGDVDAAIVAAGGIVAPPAAAHRPAAPARAAARPAGADDSDVAATGVARRLARELGVNLHDCQATGPGGRVSKSDVEEAARKRGAAAGVPRAGEVAPSAGGEAPEWWDVPLTPVQLVISERLGASMLVPHFRVSAKLILDAFLAIHHDVNQTVPGVHLSVTDFIVKASAAALAAVPDVNVQVNEDGQTARHFTDSDISVAVETDQGLITPIVQRANKKPLRQISAEIRELTKRAKAGELQPDEFQGGTFTVSNLGMFGVTEFDAIINPPQGAILAVGALQRELVDVGGHLEEHSVLSVTLTSDHRIIDGALAASFLARLKEIVEHPYRLLV
jgi:pyruvate dehydrogenase E2 component (dihydrolipoamide acetyltransferase)